jgi:hypothetical protein
MDRATDGYFDFASGSAAEQNDKIEDRPPTKLAYLLVALYLRSLQPNADLATNSSTCC